MKTVLLPKQTDLFLPETYSSATVATFDCASHPAQKTIRTLIPEGILAVVKVKSGRLYPRRMFAVGKIQIIGDKIFLKIARRNDRG